MYHIKDAIAKRIKKKSNVIVRREENCYLLVQRESGRVLVINDIGLAAWNLFTGLPVRDVVRALADKYGVEETECQEEVLKVIQKLVDIGFIDLT